MLAKKIEWLRKSQTRFPADASDQAGSLGEQLALTQLNEIAHQLHGKTRIFSSLRVPRHRGTGKYEIDLVLVSEVGLMVIEVKHWGGRLSKQGGTWIQERGNEKKSLVDPIALNADKVLSLSRWLASRGIEVPVGAMHSLVLFTNPQVVLSPELKRSGAVESFALAPLMLARCGQPRRRFWQKRPAPAFHFAQLIQHLEQLPTWDRLQLHGGRVVFGDMEYIAAPDVKASMLQRKYIRDVSVALCRRIIPGLFLKPTLRIRDWSGRRKVYPLHPDARLVFRPAGQNEKEEIAWLHVESLQLGWKDQSYYNDR